MAAKKETVRPPLGTLPATEPMTVARREEIVDIADRVIPGGPLLPLLRECLREIDRAQREFRIVAKALERQEGRLRVAQAKLVKAHRTPVGPV